MRLLAAVLLLLTACTSGPTPNAEAADPYATLRAAYAARDPAMAASAYTPDAQLIYEYDTTSVYSGTVEIEASFADFFDQIAPEDALDLNFRITSRTATESGFQDRGIYRLRIGAEITSYGGFETRLDRASGRFVSDTGTAATRQDFEALPGDVMFPDAP